MESNWEERALVTALLVTVAVFGVFVGTATVGLVLHLLGVVN